MRMKLRLPGGTLKIKTGRSLRTAEMNREVPVVRLGFKHFLIWWPANLDHDKREGQSYEFRPVSDESAPPPNAN